MSAAAAPETVGPGAPAAEPLDAETFALLLDTIRGFVRHRLIPIEEQVDATDQVPADVIADMRALGLYGLTIPAEYGGVGLTVEQSVRAFLALCYAAPVFRSLVGINNGLASWAVVHMGTEAQRRRYLPPLASGALVGAFCLTEPDSGSDAGAMTTRARRDGDHYVLSGSKRYITNAPEAGVFLVFARTDPASSGARGVSAFLVDRDTPGIRIGPPERKMGQKGAHVSDVSFDDCRVPASAMVGRVADRAVQLHGGFGYVAPCVAERLYRDVRIFRLYEGTTQIQQLIIAREMLRAHARTG